MYRRVGRHWCSGWSRCYHHKKFAFPLFYELLLICWCFPLLTGHVRGVCFSSVARARHYLDCHVTGWSSQLSLVYQIGKQDCWQDCYCWHFVHASWVAPLLCALTDESVVLLEHGGVASAVLTIVLDIATATDHSLISTNVLVYFSAEVFFTIIGAVLQELIGLWFFVGIIKVVEGVSTMCVSVWVALMTLETGSGVYKTQ